jgi:hypothetical protein
LEKKVLKKATKEGIIDISQQEKLLALFKSENKNHKSFTFGNLLYYFGGFLSIMAVTIFMKLSYDSFQEKGLLAISTLLFILGLFLSKEYKNVNNNIPSGIFATFSICVTPLIIYCIQIIFGFVDMNVDYNEYHRFIDSRWIYMEIGTLIVAGLLMYRLRFPFMVFPVAVTLWYLSMDLGILITGEGYESYDIRRQISLFFGLAIVAFALIVDYKNSRDNDYAFWLYFFGVVCFWCGLTFTHSDNELLKFIYFFINLTMLFLSIILSRKIFVVFGAIGSFVYLSHLAGTLFDGELVFSLTLIFIGFIIIRFGKIWNEKSEYYEVKIRNFFSKSTNDFLDKIRH